MVTSGHDARGAGLVYKSTRRMRMGPITSVSEAPCFPLLRIASRFCRSGVLRPRHGYFLVVAYLNGSLTCFEDRWESVRIVDILRCCCLLSEMVAWIVFTARLAYHTDPHAGASSILPRMVAGLVRVIATIPKHWHGRIPRWLHVRDLVSHETAISSDV